MTRTNSRGESLAEVVVAVLLVSVGALALVAGLAYGEKMRGRALEDSLALSAAVSWIEAWRVSPPEPASGAGNETRAWGSRSGWLEWSTRPAGSCRQEAVVRAQAGSGTVVTLVSRRFLEDACAE